jgi:glycosyltransferase involved in cell wall biosynthesis
MAAAFGGPGQPARVVTQLANGLWYVVGCNQMAAQPLRTVVRQLVKTTPQMQLFWQYTPYNFSRIGVPLYLPWLMFRFRLNGYRQAIFFHEVSVRFWGYGFKQALLALGQRLVANVSSAICVQSFTSIGLYRSYFLGRKPWVVPVGANIMPAPQAAIPPLPPVELACFANRADEALFVALAAINRAQPCRMVLLGNLDQRQQERIDACLHRDQLQALVTVTGALPEAELSRHLQAAQIFMHPQKVERGRQGGASGKNGTIIAAMAHSLPIITTQGDMTETKYFKDKENLVFVPFGESQAYFDALVLLNNETKRKSMGGASKATFNQHFAWPLIAGKIADVLNQRADV